MVGGIHGEQSRAVSRSLKWVDVWTFEVDETPRAIARLRGGALRPPRKSTDGESRGESHAVARGDDLSRCDDLSLVKARHQNPVSGSEVRPK
jgi:hypothetical protein